MKKAISALLIALTIILGVTIAGYQWVKYQYGGEMYYAVVGEGRADAAASKQGSAVPDSAAGKSNAGKSTVDKSAPMRDLVAYDRNGRKEVCTIQMNIRANKVLKKGSYSFPGEEPSWADPEERREERRAAGGIASAECLIPGRVRLIGRLRFIALIAFCRF